jgi:hypothetical protein
MAWTVRRSSRFDEDALSLARYLSDYSDTLALAAINRLESLISNRIAEMPYSCPVFAAAGEPYRGCLYRIGRRAAFWIVFRVDDDRRTVILLRLWNSVREPDSFGF